MNYSATAQNDRRVEQFELIRSRVRPILGDDARSDRFVWWDQDRVPIWLSNAFFGGDDGDVRFANIILRYTRDDLDNTPGPHVFTASALAGVLASWAQSMDDDVRHWCENRLKQIVPFGLTRDFCFNGYNDNMPVMWTWALGFAGDYFDEPHWRTICRANLLQLRDMLRRRGVVSEYGSNYSTHQLTGLAHLAEHAPDAEIQQLAADCEARRWAEFAGAWHPKLGQVCGASMRGGPPLSVEQSAMFWQVFGDDITPLPWQEYYSDSSGFGTTRSPASEAGLLFSYMYAYGAEFSSATYHVPENVARLFYEKERGFQMHCTSENGQYNNGVFCRQIPVYGTGGTLITAKLTNEVIEIPFHPIHGAQEHHLVTYHGANYTIGTASTNQFPTSHAVRVTYRRGLSENLADFGNIHARVIINDKKPDGRNVNTYWKSKEYPVTTENYCQLPPDMGTWHCLQHDNTALCLNVPDWLEHWDVREVRTDVYVYRELGEVAGVSAGRERIEKFPFECNSSDWIFIVEGATYIGIRPLIGRSRGNTDRIKLWRSGEFLVCSLFNYEGPSCELSPREMAKLGNGFVVEVCDADEYESFAAFQGAMEKGHMYDVLYGGVRRVHYVTDTLRMSVVVCPYTNTVMQRSVNGREVGPTQFEYSDGSHETLPFLHDTASPLEDRAWLEVQLGRPAETYNVID
ncbi:MAG TPA: hypothetical protein VGK19_20820 [Capsulimonadaceae bacterium]|jgi:hypothetical protein